jgi:hypothetical protein
MMIGRCTKRRNWGDWEKGNEGSRLGICNAYGTRFRTNLVLFYYYVHSESHRIKIAMISILFL